MANTISAYLSPYIVGEANEALSQTMALLKGVSRNFALQPGTKGQTLSVAKPADLTAAAVSAANTAPAPSDVTVNVGSVTLDQFYKASFAVQAKDGVGYDIDSWFVQQVREAVRAVAYKVNATLWARYYEIPYLIGTANTGLFYTGSAYQTNNLAVLGKKLTDNRVPLGSRKLVVTTSDYRDLLLVANVFKANEAGSDGVARTGVVDDLMGFMIAQDQQVVKHTTGTITAGLIAKAATAVAAGTTSFIGTTAASSGACALKTGDIISIAHASGARTYSVQADVTQASANTDTDAITLDRGLEFALIGSEAVTIATGHGTSPVNIGGDFQGFGVASRLAPAAFMNNQAQGAHQAIVDPVSGFPMMLSVYPQYHQVSFEVCALWGVSVLDSRRLCRAMTVATYA